MEKVRKRPWLPTLYFYITTVVINEKKRSFDVLCIEIIVNVQNWSFIIGSMHNTSNERFFSFITTVVILKYKVGNHGLFWTFSVLIPEKVQR